MFELDRFIADCPAARADHLGPRDAAGRIEAAGARSLDDRDAVPLGRDIIHAVVDPGRRLTGPIHVYGGDFFAVPRGERDPEALVEQPDGVDRTVAPFQESNRRHGSDAIAG